MGPMRDCCSFFREKIGGKTGEKRGFSKKNREVQISK